MNFEQRVDVVRAPVEARLDDLLSETRLRNVPERLRLAMRHGTLGQGKRFRPFLVIETARMLGADPAAALDAACALELVHCYSLVHDDLPAMDNDELRRGKPTVWKAFDEWTAILCGDALLTLAFEVMSCPSAHPDASVRAELVTGLAKAAGAAGMVGGQALDVEAERLRKGRPATHDHVRRLQGMKTGALIAFAVDAGAVVAGAGHAVRAPLQKYARALGLAFQISDDLLDVEGDAAHVGKAVAKDAALGKATLVDLLGPSAARRELEVAIAESLSALDSIASRSEALRQAAIHMGTRQK